MSDDAPQANPPPQKPAAPDSSMEEIVAAIGRIIATEQRSQAAPQPHAARGGILELTEAVDADGSVRNLAPGKPVAEEQGPAATLPPADRPPPRAESAAAERTALGERILTGAASDAAVVAFARLGAAPRDPSGDPDQPAAGGRSLEDIVREALRPLLHAWLEDHLPTIVERLVREEVEGLLGETGLH